MNSFKSLKETLVLNILLYVKILIFCCNHLCAAVDMLAWSPDGSMYIMVTDDRIDVCAFEVCCVNFCNAIAAFLSCDDS